MARKIFFTVLVILAAALPCMGQAISDSSVRDSSETVIVYRLPDPERLYIYRNGTVVYDAKIPGSAIINNSFVLPLNIQTDSFTIVQSGKRIYSYTTEKTESVTTAEFPERENLPFTHSLEYSVENLLNQNITIEISAPVTYGTKHRTQYHFTKEPDARPGDRMVWKFNVAPGEKAAVNFSFDAETKDDPLYRQFDYSSGGR
ncbi:hypothetical protein AGMMS50267_03510 [Spirochaetia bacterium]|nr:hypothetical protein AGMMS50267_03510 [Spirochaetia bacterium]